MDAREAEEMANSMLLDSPLPDAERSDERLPEEDRSDKLQKEGGGEKLPEEVPTGKPSKPPLWEYFPFLLSGFVTQAFPLDSQIPENAAGKVEDVPQKAISVV